MASQKTFPLLVNVDPPFSEEVIKSMVRGIPLTEYANNPEVQEIEGTWQRLPE
ncbi:MAG: hypothetical protein WCC06_08900 [Candidatus Aminicenantales bacterium]